MLRITQEHLPDADRFRIEGRLGGAWVGELENCWAGLADESRRRLRLDLAELTGMDEAGRYLLLLICREGARVEGASPLVEALMEDLERLLPRTLEAQ